MHKKAAAQGILIFVVIVLILLVIWLIVLSNRECSTDRDCPETHYCGSDFKCHEHQIVRVEKNDLMVPAIIIGISIVIAAFIIRKSRLGTRL